MSIHRYTLAAATAALISAFTGTTLRADTTLSFGVGSLIDLSANVQEAILPGGTTFQDSMPLRRRRDPVGAGGSEVPEPSTSAMMLIGLAALVFWRWSSVRCFRN